MIAPDPAPLGPLSPALPAGARKATPAKEQATTDGEASPHSFDALLREETAAVPSGMPGDFLPVRGKLRTHTEQEVPEVEIENRPDLAAEATSTAALRLAMGQGQLAVVKGESLPVEVRVAAGVAAAASGPEADPEGSPAGAGRALVKAEGTSLISTPGKVTVSDGGPSPARELAPATEVAALPEVSSSTDDPAAGPVPRDPIAGPPATGGPPAPPSGAVQPVPVSPTTSAPGWQLTTQVQDVQVSVASPRAETELEVRPEPVARQVAVAIARDGGGGKVELRLDPPELGRVEIHLSHTEKGALQATVVAERSDTQELMRRHGDLLARELSAAGYADVSLSFSAGSDAAAGRGGASASRAEHLFAAMAAEGFEQEAAAPARPLAVADGGLDIRL